MEYTECLGEKILVLLHHLGHGGLKANPSEVVEISEMAIRSKSVPFGYTNNHFTPGVESLCGRPFVLLGLGMPILRWSPILDSPIGVFKGPIG
jgi:hypothetical protein